MLYQVFKDKVQATLTLRYHQELDGSVTKELDGSFRKKSDTSIDSTHEIHIYVREGYIVHHV
jgi:hypothetical protein